MSICMHVYVNSRSLAWTINSQIQCLFIRITCINKLYVINYILIMDSIAFNVLYRWSSIASHLPGRTDNEIKNYWNTHLKKRLLQMGLDPMNHKPLLDGHTLALPSMGKAPCNLMFSAHHSGDEREGVSRHIGDACIGNKSQDSP